MVLDIFINGIDATENKYLSPTLNPTLIEKSKITNLFGLYLMSMGKFDKAIEYFKKAFELGYNPSLNNIGRCYKEIQEFELSKKYYLKSIELSESYSYSGLGSLYECYGLDDETIECWIKGLENNCKSCVLFFSPIL